MTISRNNTCCHLIARVGYDSSCKITLKGIHLYKIHTGETETLRNIMFLNQTYNRI